MDAHPPHLLLFSVSRGTVMLMLPCLPALGQVGFPNGRPWQKIGDEKKGNVAVSLPLWLVLDDIPGSGHISSVASGPHRYLT